MRGIARTVSHVVVWMLLVGMKKTLRSGRKAYWSLLVLGTP